MSISAETAKEHANDFAVSCCRFEAGATIEVSHLEDPAIFSDLEDSGLLKIPGDCYTIGQVLGAKLIKTIDALTPMTAEHVELAAGAAANSVSAAPVAPVVEAAAEPVSHAPVGAAFGPSLKIHIGEGKDIKLEIPVAYSVAPSAAAPAGAAIQAGLASSAAGAAGQSAPVAAKVVRTLKRKYFKVNEIVFGDETKIQGTTLTLRKPEQLCKEAKDSEDLVVDVKLEIITPDKYGQYSETIMDVQPIACKEEGELGHGVTRVMDGVVFVLTGTDANGVQIGEFGSSEGEMDRNIMWGRPGAPDRGEILIKTQVTIKAGANMERPGPLAAHKASDYITEEIRKALKKADSSLCAREEEFAQVRRPGKAKVVVVKEIMGQGAMHDNLILPVEPVGTLGAKPNVDLGNLPVMLSPLEVLDGGIHALTCIGPASKENSRHYFREPLVLEAMKDEDFDFVGVIFVGSPQANSEKFYVSKRLGMMVEAMDVDCAIVTTEGFGNNHIDFASHIEQIGERGVKVVGVSYSAVQGALVVGNKYMKYMIDNNKSKQGIENEILCNNTLTQEDAIRSLYMLRAALSGEDVKAAEKKWNSNVKLSNIEAIEKATGKKIELVDNEQSLPKSKKRETVYEKE
ncbi:MAG: D-proline reductase (dithiol) proprotein PrdA [Defluviitaleaceae bacterium]|nr:D-proline reductase (dithiol) proprotein PrdA [Defluviitaleaceae bacterium]